jgi:hypothetical protein
MQLLNRFTHWIKRRTSAPPDLVSSPALMLLRKLEQTGPVELTCDEVFAVIDQFAELVMQGQDAARLMPLVYQHLDMCPECREEYEALRRALADA